MLDGLPEADEVVEPEDLPNRDNLSIPADLLQELLNYIVKELIHDGREGFTGLCDLRLASKSLHRKTRDEFVQIAFSSRTVDLQSRSLQHLVEILQHHRGVQYDEPLRNIVRTKP